MMNFGPLTAEIGSGVCGTPANFNGFRVLASLLQRCRSTKANQTVHNVWPSPGGAVYIHFRVSCPVTEFCQVRHSLCVQASKSCDLLYWQRYCTALQQRTRNGITELSQPPIFGWAAITLGIAPHSSYSSYCLQKISVVSKME